MKRYIRVISGSIMVSGLLLIGTGSCEEDDPWATGTCYLHCSCGTCSDEISAEDNTKSDCIDWYNVQKINGDCGCPCTYEWVEY